MYNGTVLWSSICMEIHKKLAYNYKPNLGDFIVYSVLSSLKTLNQRDQELTNIPSFEIHFSYALLLDDFIYFVIIMVESKFIKFIKI